MSFKREHINAVDAGRCNLDEIDKNFIVDGVRDRQWSIDRDRNLMLRKVTSGREEYSSISGWHFHWKNRWVYVELEVLDAAGVRNGPGWTTFKIRRTSHLEKFGDSLSEFVADFKEALEAYGDSGMYTRLSVYTVNLVVEIE